MNNKEIVVGGFIGAACLAVGLILGSVFAPPKQITRSPSEMQPIIVQQPQPLTVTAPAPTIIENRDDSLGGTINMGQRDFPDGLSVGENSTFCFKVRDSDNAGWTYVSALNGVVNATTTPQTICR